MEDYEYAETLGEGAYGFVWKCKQRSTGRHVAIKGFKQAHEEPEIMRIAVREVRMLQSLKHPAIISLIEAFKSRSGRVYMVFPYVGHSAFQELDKHPDGLSNSRLKLLVWQLLQAVVYLHKRKVVHRDIKPGNILLTEEGELKLCDFGFARTTHCGPRDVQHLTSYVVTRWYRAPEVLVGDQYGPSCDIWSLGCTIAEMASGTPLFPGKSTGEQLWRIMRCFGSLPETQMAQMSTNRRLARVRVPVRGRSLRERLRYCDPKLLQLVQSCLQVDYRHRPTASELLRSSYFSNVAKLIAGTPLESSYSGLILQQQQQQQQQRQEEPISTARNYHQQLQLLPQPGPCSSTTYACSTGISVHDGIQQEPQTVGPTPRTIASSDCNIEKVKEYESKLTGGNMAPLQNVVELEEDGDEDSRSSLAPMSPKHLLGVHYQQQKAQQKYHGQQQPMLPTLLLPERQQQQDQLPSSGSGRMLGTRHILDTPVPRRHLTAATTAGVVISTGEAFGDEQQSAAPSGDLTLPTLHQHTAKGRTASGPVGVTTESGALQMGPGQIMQTSTISVVSGLGRTAAPPTAASSLNSSTSQPQAVAPAVPEKRCWNSSSAADISPVCATVDVADTGTDDDTQQVVKMAQKLKWNPKTSGHSLQVMSTVTPAGGPAQHPEDTSPDTIRNSWGTGGLGILQQALILQPHQQHQPPQKSQDIPQPALERCGSSFQLSTFMTSTEPSGCILASMMNTGTLALCDTAVFECCTNNAPADGVARMQAGPLAPNPCISISADNHMSSTVDLLGDQQMPYNVCAAAFSSLGATSTAIPYPALLLSTQQVQKGVMSGEKSLFGNLLSTTSHHLPCSPESASISGRAASSSEDESPSSLELNTTNAPTIRQAPSSRWPRTVPATTRTAATSTSTAIASGPLIGEGALVMAPAGMTSCWDNPLVEVIPSLPAVISASVSQPPPRQHPDFKRSTSMFEQPSGTRPQGVKYGWQGSTRQLTMSADLRTILSKGPHYMQQRRNPRSQQQMISCSHSTTPLQNAHDHSGSGAALRAWEPAGPAGPTTSSPQGCGKLESMSNPNKTPGMQIDVKPSLATAADATDLSFTATDTCNNAISGVGESRTRLRMITNGAHGRVAPKHNVPSSPAAVVLPSLSPSRSRLSAMISSASLRRMGVGATGYDAPGSPIQALKVIEDDANSTESSVPPRALLPSALLVSPRLPHRTSRATPLMLQQKQQQGLQQPLPSSGGMLNMALAANDMDNQSGASIAASNISVGLSYNKQLQKETVHVGRSSGNGAETAAGRRGTSDLAKRKGTLKKLLKVVKGVFSTLKT